MESIKNRRTIRTYTSADVTDELLNELLATAFRAPTMGNMQLYSVVVTRDKSMKEKLAPLHFNQPMVQNAPVVLTFCADFNRFSTWCEQRQAVPGYDNFLSFMNAATDALLVTQNFTTLAEEKGLGTCFLGTTLYNAGGIIEVLHLPKLVIPVATLTVGYPAEVPAQPDRLPLDGIVHHETYSDYTPDDIECIFAEKEALPENKNFVVINKTQTLAQIFTDIRYKKDANKAISEVLKELLDKQGFNN